MPDNSRFYLGLDLGQANDTTALAVLRQTFQDKESHALYEVPFLRRFPLGTGYPDIVKDVARIVADPQISRRYALMPDMTGVGRPVVDLLRRAGLSVQPVMITGGSLAHQTDGVHYVPKCELVTVLQVLLQNQCLRFAASLPEIQTLVNEMLAFRVKVGAANNEPYSAWREGAHDDLLLAVAMAAWKGEREAPWCNPFFKPMMAVACPRISPCSAADW